MNIIHLLLFMPLLYQLVNADCGCGIRCMKYNTAKECTRCCTHSVRRSVPIFTSEDTDYKNDEIGIITNSNDNIRIYDKELSKPVNNPSYSILNRKLINNISNEILNKNREIEQLSTLISNLNLQELNSDSARERRMLRKTRSKLQHYYRIKLGKSKEKKSERDMYQLLELILKDLRSNNSIKR